MFLQKWCEFQVILNKFGISFCECKSMSRYQFRLIISYENTFEMNVTTLKCNNGNAF